MTDDDLIIRHVRLCECGLPVDHKTICKPGRLSAAIKLDQARDAENTDRSHARYERRRREFDTQRRQMFATMNALELHRWITERAGTISTVKAGSVEPSRGGSSDTRPPSRQQTMDDDPRFHEHMSVIRWRLDQAAELILEAQGLSTVASTIGMIGADKDKLIVHPSNEGLRAQAVVDRLGSFIAGTAATVRRVRREHDLDHLGRERERDS